MDTRQYRIADNRFLCILHHTDADTALVQDKRLQSSGSDGYFRPRPRLCRHRLGELYRCSPRGYSFIDYTANGTAAALTDS